MTTATGILALLIAWLNIHIFVLVSTSWILQLEPGWLRSRRLKLSILKVISIGMVEQAKRKAETLGLGNVEFQLADAEALNFPEDSFDCIFCSSALIWMSDLLGALRHWYQLLKPGGLLGFHAFADTAFVGGVVSQRILEKYGVSLLFSKPTGTVEKCHNSLK